jgi:hypothetical protein
MDKKYASNMMLWTVFFLVICVIFGSLYLIVSKQLDSKLNLKCIETNKTYLNVCSKPEAVCISFCGNLAEIKDIVTEFGGIGK